MPDITLARNIVRQYKDFSLSMGLNPVTNDIVVVMDEEAVKRSVKTLLLTQAGEVPFFPKFGSNVRRYLFEPIDPITTQLLTQEIRATIEGFEPRVTIQSLTVTPSEDEHQYVIDLILQIVNLTQPLSLTIFLSRLR